MDGTTAAERICPWRRSSIPDEGKVISASSIPDPHVPTSTITTSKDHLRSTPLISADYSGGFHKSPEYMGEYATTTKPDDHAARPDVRDLFRDPSKTPQEERENADEDEHSTHL